MSSPGVIRFPLSSPPAYPGTALTEALNAAFAGTATCFQGAVAPTALGLGLSSLAGISWRDTSNLPISSTLYIRNQLDTKWIPVGTIDELSRTFSVATTGRTIVSTDINKDVGPGDNLGTIYIDATGGDTRIFFDPVLGSSTNSFRTVFIKKDASVNAVYVSSTGDSDGDFVLLTQQGDSFIVEADGTRLWSLIKGSNLP
jgi:hypothetical protein